MLYDLSCLIEIGFRLEVIKKKYIFFKFRSTLSLGPVHPWQFVEEAASKEVEKDYKSVFSRLVLCKTFRLNEDGKVLSPEELLYKCVEAVNFTHNPQHAQMDVKLRSLICLGLNEQVKSKHCQPHKNLLRGFNRLDRT